MGERKVSVYFGDRVVGRVGYTENLDQYDGRNYTSGGAEGGGKAATS